MRYSHCLMTNDSFPLYLSDEKNKTQPISNHVQEDIVWHCFSGDGRIASNTFWVLFENTHCLSAEVGCKVGGAGETMMKQTIPRLEELAV